MTPQFSLSVDDIIGELNLGRATVNFMLDRFARRLPHDRIQGRTCYSPEALSTLIRIKDLMDQGMMPSQVEAALDAASPPAADASPVGDVRMSQDALTFIQDLFQDIEGHQNRIARAHEKRAEAEERKAVAIEKRAEAEAKKAEAMNNIAAALQEMSRQRPVDTQTLEIAGQAAHALTMNDTQNLEPDPEEETIDLGEGIDDTDLDDLFSPPGSGNELRAEPDHLAPEELDLDDLTIEMPDQDRVDLDDLNQLVDEVSTLEETGPAPSINGPADDLADTLEDDLEALLGDSEPLPDLDGLDQLISQEPDDDPEPAEPLELLKDLEPPEDLALLDDLGQLLEEEPAAGGREMDDLSLLVDSPAEAEAADQLDDLLDDLSLLVDPPAPENGPDLDNLYDLVDMSGTPSPMTEDLDDLSLLMDEPSQSPAEALDDLSALVDAPAGPPAGLDDLSLLVDTGEKAAAPAAQPGQMDDLSALISGNDGEEVPAKAPEPSLKPDITPEQDMAKYKATVMKIIIDLKNQGLSPGDTTERLNRDEVPTLSGKPLWREKAIAKIYGFIDSAR